MDWLHHTPANRPPGSRKKEQDFMQITGNTILITGGTSGIGLELARQLLARGNAVIVTGRNQQSIDKVLAANPGLHGVQSDVGDPDAIKALYEQVVTQFPKLNVLINNAGIMRQINLQAPDYDLGGITGEIETNLMGPIRLTVQFLPHLKTQAHAAIVNVSSGLAFLPLPVSPVYCASKAAVHSFTMSLRLQLKRSHVEVFELVPPLTGTPLTSNTFEPKELKGQPIMPVDRLARLAIRGMERGQLEIRPGMSKIMKMTSRLAPNWLLSKMLGSSVDAMLDATPS
jgi:uncharacterized oxidoreductase